MKSYQSMWNACAYPMRKHSTSIGNISKSYQLMWNACPNFGKIGQFWKVTNRCGMLAHRVCASIPHRLVTFHEPRNIFNICPHQLVTFENVTYWCVMLAHNYLELQARRGHGTESPRCMFEAKALVICWFCPALSKKNQKSLFELWMSLG